MTKHDMHDVTDADVIAVIQTAALHGDALTAADATEVINQLRRQNNDDSAVIRTETKERRGDGCGHCAR